MARCPQTVAEAQEYIGSTVRKYFDEPPAAAGWYNGVVIATKVYDEEPDVIWYIIQYEDTDEEIVDWDALMQILHEPGQHTGSGKPPAAAGGQRKRAAAAVPQVVDDDDSDENTPPAPARGAKKQRRSASDHTAADGAGVGLADGLEGLQERQQKQRKPKGGGSSRKAAAADAGTAWRQKRKRASEEEALAEPFPLYEQEEEEGDGSSKFRKHGTAGHLKKIQLINFMCHANFEMDFAAHVNVISGTNGSGKSAVLQGLQCALGASAKGTGRGSKMEDLVRTGADKAHVKVTLWNIGEDAFQPETYGRWLTIERGFTRRGASDWKVLDERGKKVGDKKDLVVRILDHLSISAVNPLAIMTQETSRTFLGGSSTDGDKYRLFMEATLLQTFRDRLTESREHVEQHKQLQAKLNADYLVLVAEKNKLQKALDQLKEVDVLQEQAQQYNKGAAWLTVNLARECLLTAEAHLEVMIPSTEEVLNKLHQMQDLKVQAVESEVRVLEARVEDITRQMDSLVKEAQQSRAAIAAAKRRRGAAAKRKQELDSKVAQLEEELQVITAAQVDAGDAAAKEYAKAKAKLDAQMAKAEEGRAAAEAELQRLQQEETGLREELQQASNRDRDAKNKVNACNHTLQSLNQEHHELHNNQQSRIFMFGGRPMSQLKQEVERNKRRFSREPIGPLGMHLSLTDTKWGVAAQVALGGVLRNWLVHSVQDQQLLNQLMTKVGMGHNRPTIWRGGFDRPAYNPARIPRPEGGDWVVLRDVMRVEHPQFAHIIDNKLMDTVGYEHIVLDMNDQRARSVAEVTQMAAGRRMTRGIDVNGYSFTRKGQGGVEANRAPREMRVQLGGTVAEQLVQLQQAMSKQQEEAARLQQQLQDIGADVQEKHHETERVRKALRAAHQRRTQAEKNIRDLTMQLGDLTPPDQGTSGVAADIADLQATLQVSQLEVQDARTVLEEATQAERHVCEENQGKTQDTRRLTQEALELKEQLDAKDAERQQLQAARQHTEQQLAGQAQRRADVQAEKAKYEAGLAQALAAAQAICDEEQGQAAVHWARAELLRNAHARLDKRLARGAHPPISEEDRKVLMDQLLVEQFLPARLIGDAEKLSKQLETAQQQAGGDKAYVEGQLREAQQQVDDAYGPLKNIKKIGAKINRLYNDREAAYDEQLRSTSNGCSQKFQLYMNKRGHRGHMLVKSEVGTLTLLVKMNVNKDPNAKQVNDLKQLSGGERSTTTVAFFLALGGYTESPFRIMDEYDVFMDAVNRRHATQALLEYALDAPHLQFVLLTPQDLQTVEAAKQQLAKRKEVPEGFVRVVAMRPARQNATQADY